MQKPSPQRAVGLREIHFARCPATSVWHTGQVTPLDIQLGNKRDIVEKDRKLLFGHGQLHNRAEISNRFQMERADFDLAQTRLDNQRREFQEWNQAIPNEKAIGQDEDALAEAQRRQAEKARHAAERGIESVYRGMAEEARKQAALIKRFESPMQQAIDKMK
jgi:hypothetical protein